MKYWNNRLLGFISPVNLSAKHRLQNIKTSHSNTFTRYESLSDDPSIIFTRSLPKGWYVVEACIIGPEPLNAKLYIGKQGEFSEDRVVPLAAKSGKLYKHFFYVENRLGKLRFDPIESKGVFTLEHFKVQAVTERFALKRMQSSITSAGQVSIKRNECKARADYIQAIYGAYNQIKNGFRDQGDHYIQWLRGEATLSKAPLVKPGILFSIVMPVYQADVSLLKAAVASIQAQTYSHFEICIADDASTDPELLKYLNALVEGDGSIKLCFRHQNGHISAATNSALDLASGDFIVFMDQDDLLAQDALQWLAYEASSNQDAMLLYSDEDKIDANGNRYQPHFKPNFSPHLLLGQNYISHLTSMKKSLVDLLGGLRVGYEGAQDHDLLIRALPYLNKDNVIRIPRVLYHWRAIEGSTASSPEAKGYTNTAAVKSVQGYLDQHEAGATAVMGRGANTVKVQRPIKQNPLVSLLIPTRDGLTVLKPCIESIINKTQYTNFEILILDNDSQEAKTVAFFKDVQASDERVKVISCPGEFNFSKINNLGALKAKGEYIGLVNNDIEVIEGNWLSEMLSLATLDDVGCVGAKLLYSNNTIQHGGVILGIGGIAGHSHLHVPAANSGYFERMNLVHEVSAVTAACLLVSAEIYHQVEGLDENMKVAFNDVDFCIKVRELGYRNLFTPYAELYHHESVSRGYEDTPEKQKRFNSEILKMKNKWGDILTNDQYYNPNFNLMAEPYHFNSENRQLGLE
jgi:GT2 family glycosyltransferase